MGQFTPNKVFGKFFRLWRMNAGLTQRELADKCICATSEISKIELGTRRASHRIVELADQATGANGDLLEMLGEISWDGIKEGFPEYLKHEALANKIRSYEPLVISVLIQTEDYARAMITIRLPDAKPDAVDDLVATRMARQKRDDPPELLLVLQESPLRHRIGTPDVHRAQLDAVIEAAQRPEVTIRVIPSTAPLCAGLACGFVILSFDDGSEIAYNEDPVAGRLTDDPARVAVFVSEFDAVRAYALPVEASLELIKQIREEL